MVLNFGASSLFKPSFEDGDVEVHEGDKRLPSTSDPDSGGISKETVTKYWSCAGTNFEAVNPDTDTVHRGILTGKMISDANGKILQAPVSLPHGAIITAAVVFGSDTGNGYKLTRINTTGGTVDNLASGNMDTEDTSISNATVDNQNHGYFLEINLDSADEVHMGRVTYTVEEVV